MLLLREWHSIQVRSLPLSICTGFETFRQVICPLASGGDPSRVVNSGDPDIEPRDNATDPEPSDLMLAEAVTVSSSAGTGSVCPDGAVPGCLRQRLHLNRALPLPDHGLPNLYRGQADNETNSEAH